MRLSKLNHQTNPNKKSQQSFYENQMYILWLWLNKRKLGLVQVYCSFSPVFSPLKVSWEAIWEEGIVEAYRYEPFELIKYWMVELLTN